MLLLLIEIYYFSVIVKIKLNKCADFVLKMAAPKAPVATHPDKTAAKCNFVAQDQIWWVYVIFFYPYRFVT